MPFSRSGADRLDRQMTFSNPVSGILRWASLIALSSVTSVTFAGQDRIDFDRLSLDQGLSQSIIEQMVQDRKGFMWFATEDGLNRFDFRRCLAPTRASKEQ